MAAGREVERAGDEMPQDVQQEHGNLSTCHVYGCVGKDTGRLLLVRHRCYSELEK